MCWIRPQKTKAMGFKYQDENGRIVYFIKTENITSCVVVVIVYT